MKTKSQYIISNGRKFLNRESRISNIIYGEIIFFLVFVFKSWQNMFLIVLGSFMLLYAIIGRSLVKTSERIKITLGFIEIKTLGSKAMSIPLKNIKYIKLNKREIEFGFDNFCKSYNIQWVTEENYCKLKKEMLNLCKHYNFEFQVIEIENEGEIISYYSEQYGG